MPSVCFVHRYGPTFASYRYRCEIPAKWLNENGCPTTINGGECEIVVFAKPIDEDVDVAKKAKDDGCKIVFDVTDPHVYEHYTEMFDLADVVTCSSEYTKGISGKKAVYIPDPYEFEELKPHASYEERPQLLWFGHKVNLKDLPNRYFNMPETRVVTGPFDEVPDGITEYTPENLHRALSEANITLLPTSKGSEYKSPNRLINSLRMGVFPISGGLPSAKEFRKFCWVGHVDTGLRFANQERQYLDDLVREGQDYIKKFSPEEVGRQWKDLFDSI